MNRKNISEGKPLSTSSLYIGTEIIISRLRIKWSISGQQLAEVACSDDTRPAYISHQNTTLIETIDYPMSHPSGTRCEWIITPDNAPEVDQNVS